MFKFAFLCIGLVTVTADRPVGTPGQLEELNCNSCVCTSSTDAIVGQDGELVTTAKCTELCTAFLADKGKNALIWDFYEFLVSIGPQCKLSGRAKLPIEIAQADWCETQQEEVRDENKEVVQSAQRGWVIQRPTLPNESVPEMEGVTYDGPALIRIWQEDAAGWYCPSSVFQGAKLPNTDFADGKTKCPAPTLEPTMNAMLRPADTQAYLELTDTVSWHLDADSNFYLIHIAQDCFGKVTKIEYQRTTMATFQGLTELPKTTPPTGFETGGAVTSLALTSTSLVILGFLSF